MQKKRPVQKKSQRPAGKQTRMTFDSLTPLAKALAILMIAAVVILVLVFRNPKIEKVDIEYRGDALSTAQSLQMTDKDFIVISNVMGQGTRRGTDKLKLSAQNRIAQTGYFILEELQFTGEHRARLVISVRSPMAVISSGGKYVTVNTESYVLRVSSEYDSETEPLLVRGVTLTAPVPGQKVYSDGTDERLEDALTIASIIYEKGYHDMFTDFSLLENRFVVLNTKRGIPVRMNMRFSPAEDLALAREMLNDTKLNNCHIEVENGNGYYQPDDSQNYVIRGM